MKPNTLCLLSSGFTLAPLFVGGILFGIWSRTHSDSIVAIARFLVRVSLVLAVVAMCLLAAAWVIARRSSQEAQPSRWLFILSALPVVTTLLLSGSVVTGFTRFYSRIRVEFRDPTPAEADEFYRTFPEAKPTEPK
ncbi:MAG: hypothetical protein K8R23_01170 [Chthoniobacter sp.]|nr:hypothetical protein [Chthoniobacter sp.]